MECFHANAITHAPNAKCIVVRGCDHVTAIAHEERSVHTITMSRENKRGRLWPIEFGYRRGGDIPEGGGAVDASDNQMRIGRTEGK